MDIKQAQDRAHEIHGLFRKLELKKYGQNWSTEEIFMGFIKDVGDLSKLIMANEGIRKVDNHREKLDHELADCLWSILVLAQELDIDIESAFQKTMDELEQKLQ